VSRQVSVSVGQSYAEPSIEVQLNPLFTEAVSPHPLQVSVRRSGIDAV
jgi:hypothetical protein